MSECDICSELIEDNKHYFCEACEKAFHFKCVKKKQYLFREENGNKTCRYCHKPMIDMKEKEKLEKKMEKKQQIEEEKMALEEEKESATLDRITQRKSLTGVMESVKQKMKGLKSGISAILDIEDYKDDWTLMHGRTPVLDSNFLFFNQIDSSLNQHPNFLHFQIRQQLEALDYIIENEATPLPLEFEIEEGKIKIFNFTGYLSALIETKGLKLKGYTKIYVKEEGICYYSKDFGAPFVKGNIRITFAGTNNNMSDEELESDISQLKQKIHEFLSTEIPY
ncbi:MAG: hypothetical protein ACFFCM_17555 [Promethearchaeota archaeon]